MKKYERWRQCHLGTEKKGLERQEKRRKMRRKITCLWKRGKSRRRVLRVKKKEKSTVGVEIFFYKKSVPNVVI